MKTLNKAIFAAVAAGALAVVGEVAFDYEHGEKSTDVLTPEVEMAASMMLGAEGSKLMHALRLQMGKYDRDMKTASGRTSWHGKLIAEEIHEDEMVKVEVYSNEVNGAVWRFKVPIRPKPVRSMAAQGRKVTYSTNGIPAALAAARKRRENEVNAGVVYTNVIINANGAAQ